MAWSRAKIRMVHKKGRLRDPSLQALVRELPTFNTGLCVVTTRLPVADTADHSIATTIILPLRELAVVRERQRSEIKRPERQTERPYLSVDKTDTFLGTNFGRLEK